MSVPGAAVRGRWWGGGGREREIKRGREREREIRNQRIGERIDIQYRAHSLAGDERVNFSHGDDLGHETTQPLWV